MGKTKPCEVCGIEIRGDKKGAHYTVTHPQFAYNLVILKGRKKMKCAQCGTRIADYRELVHHYNRFHPEFVSIYKHIPESDTQTKIIDGFIDGISTKIKAAIADKDTEIKFLKAELAKWKINADRWASKCTELERILANGG